MKPPPFDLRTALVFVAAAVGLFVGWRAFWFLCDDAYIAFRYVAHSALGLGYVWNGPPFRPVEGYTSFLWVVLLDGVWRVFGAAPPRAANVLSLLCSFGTLALTAAMALRVKLPDALARRRVLVLALVLLGVVSNRTFLAWTSSGLETALFGLLWTAFLFTAGFADATRPRWPLVVSGVAALAALARPDGLLLVGAAPLVLAARGRLGTGKKQLVGLAPLAIVAAHLLFRHAKYGSFLPNTFFAKSTGAWPEAGSRYLASFVLEHGLFVWVALVVGALAQKAGDAAELDTGEAGRQRALRLAVGATILHAAYYTFGVGGDHFEYRIYAHLVPLVFVSAAWAVGRLGLGEGRALSALAAVVVLSWPIPWTHWALTKDLGTRQETLRLRVPVAPHLPGPIAWWGASFDRQQAWLIERFIGMRHQEHRVLWLTQLAAVGAGDAELGKDPRDVPVLGAQIVGVVGYAYPRLAILDELGLNDGVVARTPIDPARIRRMAHERRPPPEYLACLAPNAVLKDGKVELRSRKEPLTTERIEACERDFGARVGW